MEEELRCPCCKQLYIDPVLLPCYHSLCLACAERLQRPTAEGGPPPPTVSPPSIEKPNSDSEHAEADKLSLVSETDSGVVCSSRPNSYVGTPSIAGVVLGTQNGTQNVANGTSGPPTLLLSLTCPVCRKMVYFDDNGCHNLPSYRTMKNIVDRFTESQGVVRSQSNNSTAVWCQLCEEDGTAEQTNKAVATVRCEQCDVSYCDACRERCHPSRGPLAKHSLVALSPGGKQQVPAASSSKDHARCPLNPDQQVTSYCMVCKMAACGMCTTQHANHDVQAIHAMCKAQKTELSQTLQQLSERAKAATEFIQRIKSMGDSVSDQCGELERCLAAQCEALVEAVRQRRRHLVDAVRTERDSRVRLLRERATQETHKLQQTTALMHFCIEALKETDAAAYLQVGQMLIARVANAEISWPSDPSTVISDIADAATLDLSLDDKSALRAIQQLNFIQMKPAKDGEERKPAAPAPPSVIPEDCCAENNSVTIAWQPHPTSYVEGYVLELDDGDGRGVFREVYCGKETICTVDGLHFNSVYTARVKGFNGTGEGGYSEPICLQTAEVAWFSLEPTLSAPEMRFSNENATVTCDSYEHRVSLSTIGFSRGIHYWEYAVERYDGDADPSFGVALLDVDRHSMLGKDDKGWGMYIDARRSWFLHANAHEGRCEGGIQAGSTVGVLLDLERRFLRFYVNEEPQGSVAFKDGILPPPKSCVLYPAVSLNRNVIVTLHTALDPPPLTPSNEGTDDSDVS